MTLHEAGLESALKTKDRLRDEIVGILVTNSVVGGTDDYPSVNIAGFIGELDDYLASLPAPQGPVGIKEWRCFHCDDVFTDEHAARLHFGREDGAVPACQIKGAEGGLVEALRRAENDAADAWHAMASETTDAARGYAAQNARHQEQLRAIEQVGYDRGIADAKAHPETLGLVAAPQPPSPDSGAEGQTYYSEGKDAVWFEQLDDAEFAKRASYAAMDIVDGDFASVENYIPVVAILQGAADRIRRLLAAAPQQSPDTGAHRKGSFTTEHGTFETDETVIYVDPNGREWGGRIGEVLSVGFADFIGDDEWSRGGTYKWRAFRKAGAQGAEPVQPVVDLLGNADDPDSIAHALDIGGIGTPYRAYQGSLYWDYQQHRIADFQDYGLARAAATLFNNAKAIKAALAQPQASREAREITVFDWAYTDKDGRQVYAGTPEKAARLKAEGVKLTTVYTVEERTP